MKPLPVEVEWTRRWFASSSGTIDWIQCLRRRLNRGGLAHIGWVAQQSHFEKKTEARLNRQMHNMIIDTSD